MLDQGSAQCFPIVLPEVSDVVSPGGLGRIERGLAVSLVSEVAEKIEPYVEERQQERVEVPEHKLFKDLPPFQGVGDTCVFLGFVIGAFGPQPFALRDLEILQNVMQRHGFVSSQLDELPDI